MDGFEGNPHRESRICEPFVSESAAGEQVAELVVDEGFGRAKFRKHRQAVRNRKYGHRNDTSSLVSRQSAESRSNRWYLAMYCTANTAPQRSADTRKMSCILLSEKQLSQSLFRRQIGADCAKTRIRLDRISRPLVQAQSTGGEGRRSIREVTACG